MKAKELVLEQPKLRYMLEKIIWLQTAISIKYNIVRTVKYLYNILGSRRKKTKKVTYYTIKGKAIEGENYRELGPKIKRKAEKKDNK